MPNVLLLFPDAQLNAEAIRTSRTPQDRFDQQFDFYPWINTVSGPKYALHKVPAVQNSDLVAEYDMGNGSTKAVNFLALGRADLLSPGNVQSITLKGSTNGKGQIKDVGRRYGAMYWWDGDENIVRSATGTLTSWTDKISGITFTPVGAAPLVTRADDRCNFILQSGSLTTAPWAATAVTVALYVGEAYSVIENTATSTHTLDQAVNYLTKGVRYRASTYAVYAGRQLTIILSGNCFNYGTAPQATFSLSGGTVISTAGGGSPVATIELISAGFYRCSLTATANTSADNSATVTFALDTGAGTSYTGDGVSGIILFAPQFQRDVDNPTYILTTTFPQISGINGKRAIYFHNNGGAGCRLQASSGTVGDYTTEFTICTVCLPEIVVGFDYELYRKGDVTADGYREVIRSGDLKRVFETATGAGVVQFVSTNSVATDSITQTYADRGTGSGNITLEKNQNADGTGALAAPAVAAGAIELGGRSTVPFRGKIANFVIIDQELFPDDVDIIGLYLVEQYRDTANNYKIGDIPVTLPTTSLEGTIAPTDYKVTFTALPAYRFWTVTMASKVETTSIYPLSKLFFGTYFDFGVDALVNTIDRIISERPGFNSSTGMRAQQRGDYLRYRFILEWRGVTDDKVRDFANQVAIFHGRLNLFLMTDTDHSPLENQRLVYCKLLEWKAENADLIVDRNTVTCEFEEVW